MIEKKQPNTTPYREKWCKLRALFGYYTPFISNHDKVLTRIAAVPHPEIQHQLYLNYTEIRIRDNDIDAFAFFQDNLENKMTQPERLAFWTRVIQKKFARYPMDTWRSISMAILLTIATTLSILASLALPFIAHFTIVTYMVIFWVCFAGVSLSIYFGRPTLEANTLVHCLDAYLNAHPHPDHLHALLSSPYYFSSNDFPTSILDQLAHAGHVVALQRIAAVLKTCTAIQCSQILATNNESTIEILRHRHGAAKAISILPLFLTLAPLGRIYSDAIITAPQFGTLPISSMAHFILVHPPNTMRSLHQRARLSVHEKHIFNSGNRLVIGYQYLSQSYLSTLSTPALAEVLTAWEDLVPTTPTEKCMYESMRFMLYQRLLLRKDPLPAHCKVKLDAYYTGDSILPLLCSTHFNTIKAAFRYPIASHAYGILSRFLKEKDMEYADTPYPYLCLLEEITEHGLSSIHVPGAGLPASSALTLLANLSANLAPHAPYMLLHTAPPHLQNGTEKQAWIQHYLGPCPQNTSWEACFARIIQDLDARAQQRAPSLTHQRHHQDQKKIPRPVTRDPINPLHVNISNEIDSPLPPSSPISEHNIQSLDGAAPPHWADHPLAIKCILYHYAGLHTHHPPSSRCQQYYLTLCQRFKVNTTPKHTLTNLALPLSPLPPFSEPENNGTDKTLYTSMRL